MNERENDADLPEHVRRMEREWGAEPRVCSCLMELARRDEEGDEEWAYIFTGLMGCWTCFSAAWGVASASGLPYECARCREMIDDADDGLVEFVPLGAGRVMVVARSCPACAPEEDAA